MIVQGQINRVINWKDSAIVEIKIPNYQGEWIEELEKEKLYSFTIKEAVGKKSLNQNRTAWLLMNDIAKVEDLFPDANAVYLQVLKLAKIKTDYLQVVNNQEVLDMLRRNFRVVKVLFVEKNEKGNQIASVEVAEGMSRFDKEQMRNFIERLLYYAEQVGIDTAEYRFT